MRITDLFSKRQKRLRGDCPDVFTYDTIPQPLRVQVLHIWKDAIGSPDNNTSFRLYESIQQTLCREYGLMNLCGISRYTSPYEDLCNFVLNEKDHERVLDAIEASLGEIQKLWGSEYYRKLRPSDAIKELNQRFLEHGIGYQYENGQLIRKDSELLHSEVVRPALQFLSDKRFAGANEEFLKAHEHYRHRRLKETLNECLKVFESTMKAICDIRKWSYQKNDTAKRLIEICLSHGLIPEFQLAQLSALRSLLETGVPTIRNKLGGHGQGAVPLRVSEYYASYMLHLTAATIKFLIESEKNLP